MNVVCANTSKRLPRRMTRKTGTHIGLTIWLLPNGPPVKTGLVSISKATMLDKLVLLAKPGSWNSLVSQSGT